jgi:Flp pilus assembly pilin Flp
MFKFISNLRALISDERGVTAMEYGLIAGLIAVVIVGSITVMWCIAKGNRLDRRRARAWPLDPPGGAASWWGPGRIAPALQPNRQPRARWTSPNLARKRPR